MSSRSSNLKDLTDDQIKELSIDDIYFYNVETLKYTIIPSGYDLNKKDDEGKTLMHHYARRANVTHIKYLLDNGVSSNMKDNSDKTPLDYINLRHPDSRRRLKYRKIYKLITGQNAPRMKN